MSEPFNREQIEADFEQSLRNQIEIARRWHDEEAEEFLDLLKPEILGAYEMPGKFLQFLNSSRPSGEFDCLEMRPETLVVIGIYYIFFGVRSQEDLEMELSKSPTWQSPHVFEKWAKAIKYLAKAIHDETEDAT
jgi:hypothetical protein